LLREVAADESPAAEWLDRAERRLLFRPPADTNRVLRAVVVAAEWRRPSLRAGSNRAEQVEKD
jgi:hypothetical protein